MRKTTFIISLLFLLSSCKVQSGSDHLFSDLEKESYKLVLNPEPGSQYYFDMVSETNMHIEVEGQEVDNKNRSEMGMFYSVDKDTTGDFKLGVRYDKIKMYVTNNGVASTFDADNGLASHDPVEKMLGVMKSSAITATVSPSGHMKAISGFQEMGDRLMADFAAGDTYGRQVAKNQWDKLIQSGQLASNMEQLFTLFPDSLVRIGEKWKLNTKQTGDFDLNVKTTFKLKSIVAGVALIEAEGDLESVPNTSQAIGYNTQAHIKGQQKGRYEMEVKTGMLIASQVTSTLKGTMQVMGREIPVTIEMTQDVKGRKIK